MRNTLRLGVLAATLAVATACATPKIMLGETFFPGHDKVAKESIKPVGSVGQGDNETTLTNYYIQVCDVQGIQTTNCRTNLILENITDYQVRRFGN